MTSPFNKKNEEKWRVKPSKFILKENARKKKEGGQISN